VILQIIIFKRTKLKKTSLEIFRHYSKNKLLKDFPKNFMDMKDGW
jgi:hypothetical protein